MDVQSAKTKITGHFSIKPETLQQNKVPEVKFIKAKQKQIKIKPNTNSN